MSIASESHKEAYRERAEECRRLAHMVPNDERASFVRWAEAYEQLATDVESDHARDDARSAVLTRVRQWLNAVLA